MIKSAKKHIKSGNQVVPEADSPGRKLREVQTQIKRVYLFLIF